MVQRNIKTGKERKIRLVQGGDGSKSRDSTPERVISARPAAAVAPGCPPPCVGVAAPGPGYVASPAYYAGPPPVGPAYGTPPPHVGPAYGTPPPYVDQSGGRPGVSPMTAGLVAGGAGLVGGMLLEHALDRPDVVVVDDGFGYGGWVDDDWW